MSRRKTTDTSGLLPGGVIVVDKPADMTSAAVVRRIKRMPGINKVGHAGTLDPFATGVLVCPINKGTRLSQFFLHGRKKYAATLKLGTATDTQDHTGKVVFEKPVGSISENVIHDVFSRFIGDHMQFPPAYSALKYNGVPLYRHARNGNIIQKPARAIHISNIEIQEIRLPEVDFEVQCSGGTYIRTLCADIGERLGCGGHLRKLDRMASSCFSRDDAVPLSELEKAESADQIERYVLSMADALKEIPSYEADEGLGKKVAHGRPLTADDFPGFDNRQEKQPYIKITTTGGRLIAVLMATENKMDYKYCCVFHYD